MRRTSPLVEGRVVYVSPDALADRQSGTAYYLMHVELDRASLARAGLGLAALPRYVARESLADGSIVPVLEGHALPAQELHAVYPSPKLVPSKVAAFIAFLQEALLDGWWQRAA